MSDTYLITASEAARLLSVKPWAVVRLIEAGELPAGRLDGRYVLLPSNVRDYAERVGSGVVSAVTERDD